MPFASLNGKSYRKMSKKKSGLDRKPKGHYKSNRFKNCRFSFKVMVNFSGSGGFCLVLEFPRGGSATKRGTPSSFH